MDVTLDRQREDLPQFPLTPEGARARVVAIESARNVLRQTSNSVHPLIDQGKAILGWGGWQVFYVFAQKARDTSQDPEQQEIKVFQEAYEAGKKAGREYLESTEADHSPLTKLELYSYDTWFFLHPEKIPGRYLYASGYSFPIMVKATTDETTAVIDATFKATAMASTTDKPKKPVKANMRKTVSSLKHLLEINLIYPLKVETKKDNDKQTYVTISVLNKTEPDAEGEFDNLKGVVPIYLADEITSNEHTISTYQPAELLTVLENEIDNVSLFNLNIEVEFSSIRERDAKKAALRFQKILDREMLDKFIVQVVKNDKHNPEHNVTNGKFPESIQWFHRILPEDGQAQTLDRLKNLLPLSFANSSFKHDFQDSQIDTRSLYSLRNSFSLGIEKKGQSNSDTVRYLEELKNRPELDFEEKPKLNDTLMVKGEYTIHTTGELSHMTAKDRIIAKQMIDQGIEVGSSGRTLYQLRKNGEDHYALTTTNNERTTYGAPLRPVHRTSSFYIKRSDKPTSEGEPKDRKRKQFEYKKKKARARANAALSAIGATRKRLQ